MKSTKLQALALSFAMLLPSSAAFARTRHYKHHYSQTRGAVIGAVAGAAIDHHKPLKGAIIGAAAGEAVQIIRNHQH